MMFTNFCSKLTIYWQRTQHIRISQFLLCRLLLNRIRFKYLFYNTNSINGI